MAAGKKEEKPGEEDAGAAAAKQKKKKLFLFIGLALLLVIISVGSTVVVVKMMAPKHAAEEGGAEEAAKKEPEVPVIYYPLKPNFTVNYDVNGRQRFLQAELTLVYREEAVAKLLELHMPAVRNGLVMLLSNQTFDELQTSEGKEKLRADALKIIQDIISKERSAAEKNDKEKEKDSDKKAKDKKPDGNVEQVLFTNFVMQ